MDILLFAVAVFKYFQAGASIFPQTWSGLLLSPPFLFPPFLPLPQTSAPGVGSDVEFEAESQPTTYFVCVLNPEIAAGDDFPSL